MRAFFAMDSVLKEEAQVWWLFSHGAFFEAVCPVLSPLQPLCIAK
jgi:hypothetical protein